MVNEWTVAFAAHTLHLPKYRPFTLPSPPQQQLNIRKLFEQKEQGPINIICQKVGALTAVLDPGGLRFCASGEKPADKKPLLTNS